MPAFRRPTHRALLLALVAAASILAGCVDQEGPDCVNGVCTELAKPGDAFLTNATRPVATWDRCVGAFANLEMPKSMVAGHLPDTFEASDLVPGMADVRIDAYDCPRGIVGDLVLEPSRYAFVSVMALPTNASWNPPSASSAFVFEVFMDNESAADALAGWGLPAMVADMQVEATQTPVSREYAWTITAADRSYAFSFPLVPDGTGGTSGQFAYWAGTDVHYRVDANDSRESGRLLASPMPISMTGNAAIAQIAGTDDVVLNVRPYETSQDAWQAYPIPFSP